MTQPIRRLAAVATLFLAGLVAFASAQGDPAGRWEGTIGPGVIDLGIVVSLEQGADGWSGTIDIPAQGAQGLPLREVTVDGSAVGFVIDGVPGDPTFDGLLDGDRIEGAFLQGGQEFAFDLTRSDGEAVEGPRRVRPSSRPTWASGRASSAPASSTSR